MELTWFVSLNGLAGDEEIANIDISNNTIQVLNISQYSKLLRIIADNNVITYFWDIKYPAEIKFISVANNQLETLDGIEKLTELKTLDVSNNKLDEEDFKKLASLKNLQLIIADGNDVSDEFLGRLQTFNAAYLGSIKQ
jgi:Leucine-rich repeat (LRR) protein